MVGEFRFQLCALADRARIDLRSAHDAVPGAAGMFAAGAAYELCGGVQTRPRGVNRTVAPRCSDASLSGSPADRGDVRRHPLPGTFSMNRRFLILPVLTLLMMSPSAYAAGPVTPFERDIEAARIASVFTHALTACDALVSNTKDVCIEEARAVQTVAHAELVWRRSGDAGDLAAVAVARAESAHAVAKERCDDRAGAAKVACLKDAKAVETRVLGEAKAASGAPEVRKTAAETRLDIDYRRAVEKCDAMASDAKSHCMTAARNKAGRI